MRLLSPKELKHCLPTSSETERRIASYRNTIKDILTGKDSRLAIVLGPCSIHSIEGAISYAENIAYLAKDLRKHCFLVMRAYLEKPRTCTGWKGFLHDPFLNQQAGIEKGLPLSRQLLLELSSHAIPLATEFVDPLVSLYFKDLISWGFVGARTCSSSIHRELASCLPMPVGFKNNTDGNISEAISGIISSVEPHTHLTLNPDGYISADISPGNPDTHLVLRGSNHSTNYDTFSIQEAIEKQQSVHIAKKILIDCSHGNSGKDYLKQPGVFLDVLDQILLGNNHIAGMMIESSIEPGRQSKLDPSSEVSPWISVTDSCMGWHSTSKLLHSASSLLSARESTCSTNFS